MPVTRRKVLLSGLAVGGGLVVAAALRPSQDVPRAEARLGREDARMLTTWLRIGHDDSVMVVVPYCEMGQGVFTALPMLAAEELGADFSRVSVMHAPAAPEFVSGQVLLTFLEQGSGYTPGNLTRRPLRAVSRRASRLFDVMFTGASTTVRNGWVTFREAGAAARTLLIAEAAARWQVPEEECDSRDGRIWHAASERSLRFGELVDGAAARRAPARPVLRDPAEFRLIGRSLPRLDIPDKTAGRAEFGGDVRPPGLKHAALATAAYPDARLVDFDAQTTREMPGVHAVIPLEDAVAVVADSWWEARRAAQALTVRFRAADGAVADTAAAEQRIRDALDSGRRSRRLRRGDPKAALADAARRLEAEYIVPHLAHACMEPMNATAWVHDGRCELWIPTQAPMRARSEAARVSGVRARDVAVHTTLLGGGFGRRAEIDVVSQAVAIAREVPYPVQLLWDREQDLQRGFYRPLVICRMQGGVDERGMPVAWTQVFNADNQSVDLMPYAVPNALAQRVRVDDALPWGWWRSVDHSQHAFFTESMIDELAALGGQDPVALRRALLPADSRLQGVLERVAEASNWGGSLPSGHGRGVAISACFGSYIAQVAEVSIGPEGRLRVHRIDCALDCGQMVNPDTVRAQVEGGILFGLSAALREEITLRDGAVVQANFDGYPLLGLAESPEIHVHLLTSREPPGGVGEPPTPPVAPAVANALYAASGRRVRRLPFSAVGLA
ncbi:MAG: xanthine dehydrogenase family protein molybdopterin-binding subunit [Gammaproteobacteria bacterium]|nr:xanthine dehydrogenase family protein molybdopterin-binding subunit [Gammaproteobacteria bacterium]TVQ44003.1 MAG: xanthine dehydrogenase family protein molybdopterin-binding subunit [Gammaproteobacteria bacterium]